MDVGAYIRVSRVGERDRETFLSPTLQKKKITGWCSAGGHRIAILHTDLDVSGGSRDRPNLEDLLVRVESGELGAIVVAKLDRFARSLPAAVEMLDRIDRAGGQFVAVDDGFDTSTPYGRLAMNVLLSIAQFELERYRVQWADARRELVSNGFHWGSYVPFGFRRRDDGRLEPDEWAPIVTELYSRRAGGEGPSELAAWLEGLGARAATGGLPTPRWIRNMLASRVYLGEARAGEDVLVGAHPALTEPAIFERAQIAKAPRRARGEPALLAGVARCAGCRYAMNKTSSGARHHSAYRCRANQRAGGRCPAPGFARADALEEIVQARFFAALEDMRAGSAGASDRLAELERERETARANLTTYRDSVAIQQAIGASDYAQGLAVRQAALETAESAYVAEAGAAPHGLIEMADLREDWPEMDVPTQRRLIGLVFDAVAIENSGGRRGTLAERIHFFDAGTLAPSALPSTRGELTVRGFDLPDGAGMASG